MPWLVITEYCYRRKKSCTTMHSIWVKASTVCDPEMACVSTWVRPEQEVDYYSFHCDNRKESHDRESKPLQVSHLPVISNSFLKGCHLTRPALQWRSAPGDKIFPLRIAIDEFLMLWLPWATHRKLWHKMAVWTATRTGWPSKRPFCAIIFYASPRVTKHAKLVYRKA